MALYGWLLLRSNFVPYVMDNNESFSSFWHASNIWHFGLSKTFGLADETFSPWAAAHPVVEPHNGNFPRLFSLLLYALGAHSIELQTAVTTFTVGALVVFLAYHFFSKIGNPLFAFVTTLVLMTDYVLFAQWQVNSWRVWAGVFFFSTLLSVQTLESPQERWRWRLLAFLNAACLFYLELVFGAFVALLAGLYALCLYYRKLRALIWSWLAIGAGACAAMLVLFAQKVAYFGLPGAIEDSYLTYVARNAAAGGALKSRIDAFYGRRTDIAFWQNISDAGQFHSLASFLNAFFHYHLELFTPIFALNMLIVIAGWSFGLLPAQLFAKGHSEGAGAGALWDRVARSPIQAGRWSRLNRCGRARYMFDLGLFGGACLLFLLALANGSLIMGIPQAGRFWLPAPGRGVVALGAALLACAWLRRLARLGRLAGRPLTSGRLYAAAALLLCLTLLVRSPGVFYAQRYRPLWYDSLSGALPLQWARGLTLAAAVLAVAMTLYGSSWVLPSRWGGHVPGVFRFLGCGALAYGAAYFLIPGYLVSGYLVRYAPFAVYAVDAAVGLAIYCACVWAIAAAGTLHGLGLRFRQPVSTEALQGRSLGGLTALLVRKSFIVAGQPAATVALSLGLAGFLVTWWLHVQVTYASAMPASDFNGLRAVLQQSPLKGASFVVNNYPALAAAYTGQWAYQDGDGAMTALDRLRFTSSGYTQRAYSTPYLWMADRNTNSVYQTPDYFLCMEPEDMGSLVNKLTTHGAVKRCSDNPTVKVAADGTSGNTLIARDQSGWDAWAVVKLDWHYPPYLLPLPQYGPHRLVGFTLTRTSTGVGVQVYYRYAQQEGQSEGGSIVRLYRSSADGNLTLLQENIDGAPFLIPTKDVGDLRVSVTPQSVDTPGREYFADTDYFDDPLLSTPSNFAAQGQGQTEMRLNWVPVRGSAEMRIERRDEPASAFHQEGTVDAAAQPQFTSKGLRPGGLYSWRIRACDSAGCSPYSVVVSAVASADPLARPKGVFLLGDGFKDSEPTGAPWPRPTNGSATLWLYPAVNGPLAVTLDISEPAPLSSGSGPDVEIALDGKVLPPSDWAVQRLAPDVYRVSFTGEAASLGRPVELMISSSSYVPALVLPDSQDTNRLGVDLRSVDIESGGEPLVMVDGLPVPICSQPSGLSTKDGQQCR